MKFLFASDSFKGSLSSQKTAELLSQAALEIFPDCECSHVEVADGGEGTTDAVLSTVSGKKIFLSAHGPLGELTDGYYGALDDKRAVMEMAAVSGLPLVPASLRDPRKTSSLGTGEMIADALSRGFRDISIAIGGSATNDGGMGCMRALGVKFLDADGHELIGCGADLARVRRIDTSGLNPLIKDTSFTVMCDVTNPLCGKNGATYTFGKQKGGTPEILDELEIGMQNYRDVLRSQFGIDMDAVSGAGAAGEGAGLAAGFGGALRTALGGAGGAAGVSAAGAGDAGSGVGDAGECAGGAGKSSPSRSRSARALAGPGRAALRSHLATAWRDTPRRSASSSCVKPRTRRASASCSPQVIEFASFPEGEMGRLGGSQRVFVPLV